MKKCKSPEKSMLNGAYEIAAIYRKGRLEFLRRSRVLNNRNGYSKENIEAGLLAESKGLMLARQMIRILEKF